MKKLKQLRWLALAVWLMTGFGLQTMAQEVDDLQEYLDQLAAEQSDGQSRQSVRRGETVTIPVGLTEVDLSTFTGSTNRTKSLVLSSSVKFINGTLSAAEGFSGGGCLLKIQKGAELVLDSSAEIDASAASSANCLAAVGIYGGSTFYQQGDVTAPSNGTGIAIYLDGSGDTYNYVSGTTRGTISNENGGTVNGLNTFTYDELKAKLDGINTKIQAMITSYFTFATRYHKLAPFLFEADKQALDVQLALVKATVDALADRYAALAQQLEEAVKDDYPDLNSNIKTLDSVVEREKKKLPTDLFNLEEAAKASAAADIQQKLNAFATTWAQVMETVRSVKNECVSMNSVIGDGYFLKATTTEFSTAHQTLYNNAALSQSSMTTLQNDYNTTVNQNSIASIEDAVSMYERYNALAERLQKEINDSQNETTALGNLRTLFNALTVNFPDEEAVYNIVPTGLTESRQMGYKSNRGFVLTSAGMMYFEQVSGATFRLKDAEDNYVVATSGSTVLTTGTQEQATVWTGRNLGNGQYTIYSNSLSVYLSYGGIKVNSPIKVASSAYSWSITESDLDDLQAFLNLMAEEEEEESQGESGLTEKDTLTVVIPVPICMGCNDKPWRFPRVKYPIRVVRPKTAEWYLPHPGGGGRRPSTFHPMHVPEDSHVIFDDVDIPADNYGGDHIIYVEGIVEININVTVVMDNWDWFAHIGPKGRVIWHPKPKGGRPAPRIKNEGVLDIPEGELAHVENTGTVNHGGGTVVKVVNRKVYYFTGGIINDMQNYAQYTQSGGTVLTAYNFADGTYTMNGGSIINTVVNTTEIVFRNYGVFYFNSGIIGGYGRSLIYHGKGAKLRIDGGRFDFSHVKDYWIEADDDFYIQGDYDFKPTVPMLLQPNVIVRVLYKWIYKFNIVFVGGRPTPRCPVFWGEGFNLTRDHIQYIGWELPNKRWRWYFNAVNKTIEPRDEEVYDEDDLVFYISWLNDNKQGEAASTETNPQQLDLKERIIYVTQPVVLPVGTHVFIKGGQFVPQTWTGERMFYIPSGSTMKMENVVVDMSLSTHYMVSGKPVIRYIFDVVGNMYFGPGCHVKGYLNRNYLPTDTYIPGAVVRIDPAARFYLNGGRMDDVVIRLNQVINIYVTVSLTNNLYFYIPEAYRTKGFRFLAPYSGYQFTTADMKKLVMFGASDWGAQIDAQGYASLYKTTYMAGDADGNDQVTYNDAQYVLNYILGKPDGDFIEAAADVNKDNKVDITDLTAIIKMLTGVKP